MNPNINIISIAVNDLDRAIAFYRDGLEWPCQSHPTGASPLKTVDEEMQDHALFEMQNGLTFVLYQRESMARDAEESDLNKGSTDFIITFYVQEEADVQGMISKVTSIGGRQVGEIKKQSWGTTALFRDLDNHLWEVMWNGS